jgi:uncharacterized protein YwgA
LESAVRLLGTREKVLMVFGSANRSLRRHVAHSLVYLLSEDKKISFPAYIYVPYHGPYSSQLQNDLNFLTSIGNLEVGSSEVSYKISRDGREVLGEWTKDPSIRSLSDRIEGAVKELFDKYDSDELLQEAYRQMSLQLAKRMSTVR